MTFKALHPNGQPEQDEVICVFQHSNQKEQFSMFSQSKTITTLEYILIKYLKGPL